MVSSVLSRSWSAGGSEGSPLNLREWRKARQSFAGEERVGATIRKCLRRAKAIRMDVPLIGFGLFSSALC